MEAGRVAMGLWRCGCASLNCVGAMGPMRPRAPDSHPHPLSDFLQAIALVYDVTDRESFENISNWTDQIEQVCVCVLGTGEVCVWGGGGAGWRLLFVAASHAHVWLPGPHPRPHPRPFPLL